MAMTEGLTIPQSALRLTASLYTRGPLCRPPACASPAAMATTPGLRPLVGKAISRPYEAEPSNPGANQNPAGAACMVAPAGFCTSFRAASILRQPLWVGAPPATARRCAGRYTGPAPRPYTRHRCPSCRSGSRPGPWPRRPPPAPPAPCAIVWLTATP